MILRELLVASDRLLDEKTNEPLTHYPIVSATCRNLRRECDAILYRENSLMIKIKVESPEPASWLTPDDLIASVPALAHGQLVRFSSITSALGTTTPARRLASKFNKFHVEVFPNDRRWTFNWMWHILPDLQGLFHGSKIQLHLNPYSGNGRNLRSRRERWAQVFTIIHCTEITVTGVSDQIAAEVEGVIASGKAQPNLQLSLSRLQQLLMHFRLRDDNTCHRMAKRFEDELTNARDTFDVAEFKAVSRKVMEAFDTMNALDVRRIDTMLKELGDT